MILKFRAWDKKRGGRFKVNAIRFNHPNGFESTVLVDEGNGVESTLKLDDCILMQSTGLKDINGVEIFEGDILEIVYPALIDWDDITNIDKGVVVFKDYELSVRVDDEFFRLKEIEKCIDVEVIGNIYENKELLED